MTYLRYIMTSFMEHSSGSYIYIYQITNIRITLYLKYNVITRVRPGYTVHCFVK